MAQRQQQQKILQQQNSSTTTFVSASSIVPKQTARINGIRTTTSDVSDWLLIDLINYN